MVGRPWGAIMGSMVCSMVLLLFLPPSRAGVQVLVFPRDQGGLTSPLASLAEPPATNLTDLTACLWVSLASLRGQKVLSYRLEGSGGVGLTLQEEYGFVRVKSVDLLFDYLEPLAPRRWRHFCLVYREEGQAIAVYQGGRRAFLREGLQVLEGTPFHPALLEQITWGSQGKQELEGEVTLARVWTRAQWFLQ